MTQEFVALAKAHAIKNGLAPELVLGVIDTESSGDPFAFNPEPKYRYLWDINRKAPFRKLAADEVASGIPPVDFPAPRGLDRDTEWWGQRASWGLMQVMGAVAREQGLEARYLTALLLPEVGILHGCKYLARLKRRFVQTEAFVAAYNAGTPELVAAGKYKNQEYVDKVLAAAGGWLNV